MYSLLDRIKRHSSEEVAVIDEDEKCYSYNAFIARVGAFLSILEEYAVAKGSLIGLDLKHSFDYIAWLVAILEYGSVYVVIDHNTSPETIAQIKSNCHHIVNDQSELEVKLEGEVTAPLMPSAGFLVYSSGTTGPPKGIYGTINAMLGSYDARFKVISFPDGPYIVGCRIFFVWECLRPLLKGKTVAVLRDYFPESLSGVDEICSTFGYLQATLLADGMTSPTPAMRLKRIILNGERIDAKLGAGVLNFAEEVWNLYSISECHDVSAHKLVGTSADNCAGIPFEGVSLQVDEKSDEVFIKTPFMSTGYLYTGSNQLKPISNPYGTGDRGTITEDGLLIHGRVKFSARIDGRTINLEEVEAYILNVLGFDVTAFATGGYRGRLGIISDQEISPEQHEMIRKGAPFPQMVPSIFERGAIELLPSGKKVRKVVPTPEEVMPVVPSGEVTLDITLKVLSGLLGYVVTTPALEDRNSLTVARLASALSRAVGRRVRPLELYKKFGVKATPKIDLEQYTPSRSPSSKRDKPSDSTKSVLVTGTTGFLGFHVCEELVARGYHVVTVIRRAADRFAQTAKKFKSSIQVSKVEVHVGEISLNRFGLSEEVYHDLAGRVDYVVHAAAVVQYTANYAACRNGTVMGTLNICRFIEDTSAVLMHIGTNGVFAMGHHMPPKKYPSALSEEGFSQLVDQLAIHDGYGISKWVAEGFVRKLRDKGFPVHIIRPGNIGPSGRSGIISETDFQFSIFRAMKHTTKYPVGKKPLYFELTPLDLVVDKTLELMESPVPREENCVGNLVPVEEVGKALGFIPCSFGDLRLPGSKVMEAVAVSPASFSIYMEDNSQMDNANGPMVDDVIKLMEMGCKLLEG